MLGRLTLALVLTGGPALAGVLGGGIVQQHGQGQFIQLDPATGFTVGQDNFDTDHLYAFDEDQTITLTAPLAVDIGGSDGVIPAGSAVASHYVFFDSIDGFQIGWVTFDAEILGIATQSDTLAASDFLAKSAVRYVSTRLRGLETSDMAWIDAENLNRLWVSWAGSSPGDYIRVFTRQIQSPPLS